MFARTSPRLLARMAAVFALLTILAGIFSQGFVSARLIVFSNAAATATNILSQRNLFQLGFTVFLIEMACQVIALALFYELLRPVNKSVAVVAAFLELTGCAVKTFARVFYITPLWVLNAGPSLSALTTEQLQTLALVLLKINDQGAAAALAFFGFATVLQGYLVFRSTFLPRWLGVLSMIAVWVG